MAKKKKLTESERAERELAIENADRLLALARKAQAELDSRKPRGS